MLLFWVVKQARQMITAGLGGGVATAIDMTTLFLLVKQGGMPVAPAAFLGATAGAAACFAINKYVAFRDRSPVSWQQLGRFGFVAVTTALLMALAMQVIAVGLGVPLLVAKLACSALVFLLWTYPAQRRLVFRRRALSASTSSASMSLS